MKGRGNATHNHPIELFVLMPPIFFDTISIDLCIRPFEMYCRSISLTKKKLEGFEVGPIWADVCIIS